MKAILVYIEGEDCGVIGMVKCNTFRWFSHVERMGKGEVTRKIFKGGVNAVSVLGRQSVAVSEFGMGG